MSFIKPVPAKLSMEVLQSLGYSLIDSANELILKKHQLSLEKHIQLGVNVTEEDIAALARVYFNQKEYKKFLNLCKKFVEKINSQGLFQEYIIGSLMIQAHDLFPLIQDITALLEPYFNKKFKQIDQPIIFSNMESYGNGKQILVRHVIKSTQKVFLQSGPCETEIHLNDLIQMLHKKRQALEILVDDYSYRKELGQILKKETKYLTSILGENILSKLCNAFCSAEDETDKQAIRIAQERKDEDTISLDELNKLVFSVG